MTNRHQPIQFVCAFFALALASIWGCSPSYHKDKADKEVYKIIDQKWRPGFGEKANYIIADSNLPAPNDIKVETIPTPPETITLAQAVAIATASSRDYQTQKETLYTTALSLSSERHNYETQLFGNVNGIYTDPGTGNNNDREFTLGSSVGAQQEFLIGDGIDIATNLAVDWGRFLTGDPRTTLGSVLTTTITVPLMGNGAGKQKRETLIQRERDVVYAIRDFNRYRQTFVVGIINAYYGVLQQRDTVTNAKNNYQRQLESKDRLEMEYEAGRRTRIDVDESRQNVLRAQDSVVSAELRYANTLDRFKRQLAIATDKEIELDQNELAALKEMGVTEPAFALDEAIETALLRRMDLANTADKIDDNLRRTLLAADGLSPQINASANMNYSSPARETDFQNLRFQEGAYEVGFDAELPFDRKFERNDYRRSLINLEQQKRRYADGIDNVKLEVRDAYRLLLQTAEEYKIQVNSLNLANQRVESNKLLLDAGRVTVRILLESQDALVNAENAVTGALIDHLNAKLSFYRDVGILQVKPDGMWAQMNPLSGKPTNGREQQKQFTDENL
jgi:outer membrane protein TolC